MIARVIKQTGDDQTRFSCLAQVIA